MVGMRTRLAAIVPMGLAGAVALSMVSIGAGAPAAHAADNAEPTARPAYLFTVESPGGITKLLKPRGQTERMTLTLDQVDPVTMFTDRPLRKARMISPAGLASNWEGWFASSPPNAVLTWSSAAGKSPSSFVVTLTSARYDAKTDRLTFTAERDRRRHDPVEKGANWQRLTTPATFTEASLFIDDAGGQDDTASDVSVTDGGGSYPLGSTGPGGGVVFLIADGVHYEMAPNNWSPDDIDPIQKFCDGTKLVPDAFGTAVGTGAANTAALLASSDCSSEAATAVTAYSGGGLTDWFLPSQDELNAICNYSRNPQAPADPTVTCYGTEGTSENANFSTGPYAFAPGVYWSSSQTDSTFAWRQYMQLTGYQFLGTPGNTLHVRPIRSF